MTERDVLRRGSRVVVKVGTGVVARPDGRLALGRMGALVEQLQGLREADREVILVSSGAVGLGAERLGFERKPSTVVDRQACASAGQSALMSFYDGLFRQLGGSCAQVLLTEEDFHVRHRHVHLAATLQRLLSLGVVPIINENDTVSTAEIALTGPSVFGDNDQLSALVASGLGADVLLLLSNVDGVYSAPPGEPGSERIPVWTGEPVARIGAVSQHGRGGMAAKIVAAQLAASSGVHTVIADGNDPDVVARVLDGEDVGTLFPAVPGMSRRKSWLAFATVPRGRLVVNAGAYAAVVRRKASLLAVGVVAVDGDFALGDVVSICTEDGVEFARGRCDRAAADVVVGGTGEGRDRALVHRDHVVVLQQET